MKRTLVFFLFLSAAAYSRAQVSFDLHSSAGLPQAPVPQIGTGSGIPNAGTGGQQSSPAVANTTVPQTLSIKDAEELALNNNPQISVARLTALASQQVTRETRSA